MGSIFAHTFLVTNGSDQPTLQVVAPEELMARRKRPHRCDEADPCGNCVKRGERCVRHPPLVSRRESDNSSPPTSIPSEIAWSPTPEEPDCGPVNLLHMELLHHFEKFTQPTLIFQGIWPTMLRLAFQTGEGQPLDLSGDRLYWLSTGQRQIFFMAWPLFQSHRSVFSRVAVLQPCMALEDLVGARGLNWHRHAKGFMDLYDNPRHHGGRAAFPTSFTQVPQSPPPSSPAASTSSRSSASSASSASSPLGFHPHTARMHKVLTLWQSYKEGEQFIEGGGTPDEALTRAAYKRLVARLAIAMAYIADREGCPASSTSSQPAAGSSHPLLRREDVVRYVLTFAMLCFGPLLPLISSGDSRILVLLFHMYRAVEMLLPSDDYWWCRRRVAVMQAAIKGELRARGSDVCLRGLSEVM
ncbi:hypothetical protein B0T25DRAFT_450974 [Lasiosphaeria hispida]|uniref:Zn(2)-C6 fungal-type domain-containing protein n=1 Tax=Lasiosphaeria hispida TaxID=260671 RepID=A0AAJ0HM88_9PEZI|nr:hypothetical protein B0T25DRAFT_450974 [Lasiosphaeria hispida]